MATSDGSEGLRRGIEKDFALNVSRNQSKVAQNHRCYSSRQTIFLGSGPREGSGAIPTGIPRIPIPDCSLVRFRQTLFPPIMRSGW